MTTGTLTRQRGRIIALLLTVTIAALAPAIVTDAAASGSQSGGYGWPVRPFHRQHPVRSLFGDPRMGRAPDGTEVRQFHFGIDIYAPNGTPVFATQTGTVTLHPLHEDVVLVTSGAREFSYWHIIPCVRPGTTAVAYETMLGRIEKPWAHVHFSESVNGVYLNPLRPGALGPYRDGTRPAVQEITVERHGALLDLAVVTSDETPLPVPRPWADKPVVPALVRWRLRSSDAPPAGWRTAVDFRLTIPSASLFDSYYAPGTIQNQAAIHGRYRFYLARGVNPGTLARGRYVLEVAAADGHSHTVTASCSFVVRGGGTGL